MDAVSGHVLVVDDDRTVTDVVRRYLERAGYVVRTASDGGTGLADALADPPALLVLDLMLPVLEGLEVFRRLRAEHPVPVVMLTARGDEADRIAGLELGADDYLAKPFSPRELVARVQALLRRPRIPAPRPAPVAEEAVLRLAGLEVDEDSREVRVGGVVVDLTRTEFDLLAALASRPGRVLQRETLLREVWQTDWEGSVRLVEAHMSNLRRKLQAAGLSSPSIRTVRGVGYRLVA